jgi:hypothetical protein
MGRRAHKADPARRRPVEAMAAYGVPETDIARWWVRSENAAQALPRRTRPGRDQRRTPADRHHAPQVHDGGGVAGAIRIAARRSECRSVIRLVPLTVPTG